MNKGKIYIIFLLIHILIGLRISYGQIHNDKLVNDTVPVLTGVINYLDIYNTKWMTIGTHYEFYYSTIGLELSNGYDERPLIHFEDFSEDFVFKLTGNTDFQENYSYSINVGWKYPRYLSLIAIGFYDYNYLTSDFLFQDLNISGETYLKNTDITVKLKLAYHNLNSNNSAGIELGLSKIFIYRKLYAGLAAGYFFDYYSYSGFIKSFVYKDIIGIQLKYDKINTYDFLNLGMSFTFKR